MFVGGRELWSELGIWTSKMKYRGFTIVEDNMLGFSLLCPKGHWCRSSTIEQIKDAVDGIKEAESEQENKLN